MMSDDVIWVDDEQGRQLEERNRQWDAWLASQPMPTDTANKILNRVWTDPRLQLTNHSYELEQERQRQRKRQRLQQAQQRQRSTGPSL